MEAKCHKVKTLFLSNCASCRRRVGLHAFTTDGCGWRTAEENALDRGGAHHFPAPCMGYREGRGVGGAGRRVRASGGEERRIVRVERSGRRGKSGTYIKRGAGVEELAVRGAEERRERSEERGEGGGSGGERGEREESRRAIVHSWSNEKHEVSLRLIVGDHHPKGGEGEGVTRRRSR